MYTMLLSQIQQGGVITFGTPTRIPGAVSLSLTPKGDKTEFPAG